MALVSKILRCCWEGVFPAWLGSTQPLPAPGPMKDVHAGKPGDLSDGVSRCSLSQPGASLGLSFVCQGYPSVCAPLHKPREFPWEGCGQK